MYCCGLGTRLPANRCTVLYDVAWSHFESKPTSPLPLPPTSQGSHGKIRCRRRPGQDLCCTSIYQERCVDAARLRMSSRDYTAVPRNRRYICHLGLRSVCCQPVTTSLPHNIKKPQSYPSTLSQHFLPSFLPSSLLPSFLPSFHSVLQCVARSRTGCTDVCAPLCRCSPRPQAT